MKVRVLHNKHTELISLTENDIGLKWRLKQQVPRILHLLPLKGKIQSGVRHWQSTNHCLSDSSSGFTVSNRSLGHKISFKSGSVTG